LNTTLNNAAFVDIEIVLPTTGITDISNIQIMGQKNVLLPLDFTSIPDETLERQEDHLFHFYNPHLQYKPIPSHLVGWDFPLNPTQFGSTIPTEAIGANKSYYVWDQTILFQSTNSGISATKGANGDLELTAAATTQMALIQYVEGYKAREILNSPISVNIAANGVSTLCTVSLWYTTNATLPNLSAPTHNSLVLTLDANGKPATFNGTWLEVPRRNGQNATFTLSPNANNTFTDHNFNGWDLQGAAGASTATFFAIVIGTAPVTSPGVLKFYSVGLCSGDIATRPGAQTVDEVLRECQYYYEKSYTSGVLQGTTTNSGVKRCPQTAVYISTLGNTVTHQLSFSLEYMITKRKIPNLTFYTPTGTINFVTFHVVRNNTFIFSTNLAISSWDLTAYSSPSRMIGSALDTDAFVHSVAGSGSSVSSIILFHYLSDSRLGIVL